jgi:hypothetical protein
VKLSESDRAPAFRVRATDGTLYAKSSPKGELLNADPIQARTCAISTITPFVAASAERLTQSSSRHMRMLGEESLSSKILSILMSLCMKKVWAYLV